MKYIVLVGDGMADYPLEELSGKTPLEAAKTNNMDYIARNGIVGMVKTIPDGYAAGSDVANMSILGYDPKQFYTGRGPLEAKNLGIDLADDEVAFRCNLVTTENNKMIDYSAGHITSKEAQELIKFLDKKLGSKNARFYPGTSYRHILVLKTKGFSLGPDEFTKISCAAPHDITGESVSGNMPKGNGSEILIKIMKDASSLLMEHEINHVRLDLKENPANMIWLWGCGVRPKMEEFKTKFGVTGSMISAVDLLKGIAKMVGLKVINVPGATGYYDTNYKAKAQHALGSLKDRDFVFVHVEAPDEAGHNGDIRAKISAIENFDYHVVGTILNHYKRLKNYRIMVLPDHATPVKLRTHVKDDVFFAMCGKGIEPGDIEEFNEKASSRSSLKFDPGYKLMEYFIKGEGV